MVYFLFGEIPAKADDYYGHRYLETYSKFDPLNISNLRQLEDAVKNKAVAVCIAADANPAIVTAKDLERLGKSLPLQCLVIESSATEYKDGRYLRFMPKLEVLKLKSCSPEALGFIPKIAPLKYISCAEKFNSRCLPNLGKLTHLEELSLKNCKISDDDFKYLQCLTNLKVLDLRETSITGSGLKYLSKCSKLKHLDLSRNKYLSDVALVGTKYFPDLRFLSIMDTSVGDAGFQNVACLKKIESISFGDTKVSDRGMAALSNLGELSDVSFWCNNVTDTGMQHLANCKKLVSIHIVDCPITDKAITYLVALPKLSDLFLKGTKITDKSVPLFVKMPALEHLNVEKTAISKTAWDNLVLYKTRHRKPFIGLTLLSEAPILCGNSVFIRLDSSEILVLDKLTGRQLWSLNDAPGFMVPFKNTMIFIGYGGIKRGLLSKDYSPKLKVTALRASTGKALWSYTDSRVQTQAKIDYAGLVTAEIDANHLFVFLSNGRAICLDLSNGNVLWDKTYDVIPFISYFHGQNPLVGQDSKNFYLGASTGVGKKDNNKFVVAINKNRGNIAWRSSSFLSANLLIETLTKTDCLLVFNIPQSPQGHIMRPQVSVLDKNTGHLLKVGNMQQIELLPMYDWNDKNYCLTQGHLFYIEQVDAAKDTGRFCSLKLKVGRAPSNTKMVFNTVKSSIFQNPRFESLTKEGLLVWDGRNLVSLNTDDLKAVFKFMDKPSDSIDKIMAITRIKNQNQVVAVASMCRNGPGFSVYFIEGSPAKVVSFRIPDGKRLFTLSPDSISWYFGNRHVYDNDSKLLFMAGYKVSGCKFSCWNLKTAKQLWTFNMPLRPRERQRVCGTGDYDPYSLEDKRSF
jgi:Leucine-rich repeat (LRR) protein